MPDPATLCATLFIELTSDESIREWLPRLVGIERSIVFHLGDGSTVRSRPEAQHEQQLTRTDTTSAVHYLVFSFEASQMASFASGPVVLGIDHPSYSETADLLDSTVQELLGDLLAVS